MRVAFVLWATQLDQVRARSALSLPQGLYSEYTREIINRYRKLGITRSILRSAVAVAMLIMYGSEHRPIRISSIGVNIILGDGIPLQ